MKPQARQNGLLIRDLGEETVVYDLERHEAHCLNPSAVHVFKRCDGQSTVAGLAAQARRDFGPEADERWVEQALRSLEQAHLLEPGSPPTPAPASAGRRELLKRAGLGAALLLPVVVSMVAPTPAEAAATCVPALPDGSCPAGTPDFTPCYTISDNPPPCTRTCQGGICT